MTDFMSFVDKGEFTELFEELGWDQAPRSLKPVSVKRITVGGTDEPEVTAEPVASQDGLTVWVVRSASLPSVALQRTVDDKVRQFSAVRLIIFTDGTHQSWRWPRSGATAATNQRLLHHHYKVGNEEQRDDLARRLAMIELKVGERIGITEIQARMAKAFNDEAVRRSQQASGHMKRMNQTLLDADVSTDSASSLLVRLLFLFFGDDTRMWADNTFQNWVLHHTTGENIHAKLTELFEVLCDPELDGCLVAPGEKRKGRYAGTEFEDFRRIDGMYRDRIALPHLNEDFRQQVMEAGDFDWAKVNPDIFGAMFQQLVDPAQLREMGEHYTSEENIQKVIEPLFLDEYRQRFEEAYDDHEALLEIQEELASLQFLDPACGCGNFLIQAYKHLRGLEFEILTRADELETAELKELIALHDSKQKKVKDITDVRRRYAELTSASIEFGEDVLRSSKLSMRQFFGIEINPWPAKVASTAMLLVDHLCNQAWGENVVRLPIEETPEITCADALQSDWNQVMPAKDGSYIIGNPPFLGARNQSKEQKEGVKNSFKAIGASKNLGNVDLVAAWYAKAAGFIGTTSARCCFVSTNSICQGEQVANIWHPIWNLNVRIDFAHNTFRWGTEAESQAHVFCVVVGFSKQKGKKKLYHHATPDSPAEIQHPKQLNAYLADAPDIFIWNRSTPVCDVPSIGIGNKPIDGGNYLFTPEEKDVFLNEEPGAEKFFHRWMGSQEFIRGIERWVLWLGETSPSEIAKMPAVRDKVRAVREFRLASKSAPTRKLADTPTRFHVENMPRGNSILIPEVSSERRRYIPIGFVGPETICSNKVRLLPNGTLFDFGLLHSLFHNAWMRQVAGRLKSDYQYSVNVVYNNFVWPDLSGPDREQHRKAVEDAAQAVLDARAQYPDSTIAEMYDPDKETLFPKLTAAHNVLDTTVEIAYGVNFNGDEKLIVEHLFNLYKDKILNQC